MEETLKKVAIDYNTSEGITTSATSADGSHLDLFSNTDMGPIAKIVSVLNRHHESLAWLDEKSK
jgi:hypothetical protein